MLPFVSQVFIGFMLFVNHCGNEFNQDEMISDEVYPTIMVCQARASLVDGMRPVCGTVFDHEGTDADLSGMLLTGR